MAGVKISVVGAGSAVFSLGLVRDLCLTEGLEGSTVSFMDINKERLDMIYTLARRYADEVKANLKFQMTMNRREALQDSDFAIIAALVGGYENIQIQRAVGEKHGYYRGLFGIFGQYHQLKLFLDVARDMEEICPNAWLLLTANPVFDGSTLITRETKTNAIGICHGHLGYRDIARTMGLHVEDVTCEAPGLNHCIWMTRFLYRGKDAYPLLDEWIETKAEEYWNSPAYRGEMPHVSRYYFAGTHSMSRAAVHMYRLYGLFPVGDTARGGGWWYHTDLRTKQRWYGPTGGKDSELMRPKRYERLTERIEKMIEVGKDVSTPVTKVFPPFKSRESHIPIIDAMVNDKEENQQLNIPNKGAIPGIADDVVVEIPTIVSKRGIQGVHVGSLPKLLMREVIQRRVIAMERTLDAFLTGDRNLLLLMVLEDHRTRSLKQAEAVLEDLLSLPFNRDMTEYFK